jgi:predicted component of type VI protein secretion system
VKVARKERRAKVQDFRSLGNGLKSFSKNLKKVLTNERSCSIIAKHLRETSGSESLESEEIGP